MNIGLQRIRKPQMVLVELGHEAAVRPHDRSFGPDGGERLLRGHLAGGDKVGHHYGRTSADTHVTVDLLINYCSS